MPTPPEPSPAEPLSSSERADYGPLVITMLMFLGVAAAILPWSPPRLAWPNWGVPAWVPTTESADWVESPLPLVMIGGDPHIRALMRTISASESNMDRPYRLLYGGQLFSDVSRHPDRCVPIETGPNLGDCTTAAGRYQFLTTTWEEMAAAYHPRPPRLFGLLGTYDFSPRYQDEVVYRWLSDADAWGTDLAQLLRQGQIDRVLERLSGTWTSLGYGIETNSMSSRLTQIYGEMLLEELGMRSEG